MGTNLPGNQSWGASGAEPAYILITHEVDDGVDGGTAVAGSWQTRPINTEKIDSGNYASVSANLITLAQGTYDCDITSETYQTVVNQVRLYDNTNAVVLAYGTVVSTRYNNTTPSTLSTRFTLAGSTNLYIQHRVEGTKTIEGFGLASSWTGNPETYASFKCLRW